MDIYLNQNRFMNYYLAMAQIDAQSLWNVASQVASAHFKDGLTRIRFLDEIKGFISNQLNGIKQAKDDEVCKECINNLKTERNNLQIQDRMLRTGEAYLTAAVKLYEENGKIAGYVICAIGIVAGGIQLAGGFTMAVGSAATGNVLGVIAGATLIFHGTSNLLENIDKLTGVPNPRNIAQDAYMGAAEFLGFERKTGMLVYQGMNLATSLYGLFRPILKPDSRRLFDWLSTDYYSKISTMTRSALLLEVGKSGHKLYTMGKTYNTDEHEFAR